MSDGANHKENQNANLWKMWKQTVVAGVSDKSITTVSSGTRLTAFEFPLRVSIEAFGTPSVSCSMESDPVGLAGVRILLNQHTVAPVVRGGAGDTTKMVCTKSSAKAMKQETRVEKRNSKRGELKLVENTNSLFRRQAGARYVSSP